MKNNKNFYNPITLSLSCFPYRPCLFFFCIYWQQTEAWT